MNRLAGILIGLLICIVAVPVAVLVTIICRPLWAWLESTTGIEAIGHSGPAEWCYLCIYLIVICCAGLGWAARRRGSQLEKQ